MKFIGWDAYIARAGEIYVREDARLKEQMSVNEKLHARVRHMREQSPRRGVSQVPHHVQ